MELELNTELEETLDPEDWEQMRELGHRMVDDTLSYLENGGEQPVWQPFPEQVKLNLNLPLPRQRLFHAGGVQHPAGTGK